LVIVLVVIVVATFAVYSFTELMQAYDQVVQLNSDRAQANLLVESGAAASRLLLAQPPETRELSGGLENNPALFQAINVVPSEDPYERGNFTIIAPSMNELGELARVRFGLQNESARLNLNALVTLEENASTLMAAAEMVDSVSDADSDAASLSSSDDGAAADSLGVSLLLSLPGMTTDTAEAILDWLDPDDEPRAAGAESEYYSGLPSPYLPSNGPLDSVAELLLVRGVTPSLLFGADANRNGVIDPAEQQNVAVDTRSVAALGWSAYLTVHSLENNKRADGTPRIHVNQEDLETLYSELGEALGSDDWASFIVAYRVSGQAGAAAADADAGSGEDRSGASPANDEANGDPENAVPWTAAALDSIDLSGGGSNELSQLLDLVGATVTVGQGDDAQTFASPFSEALVDMAEYMPALMGNLTTQDFETMPGRIHLNQCPADLLRGVPFLDPEVAEAIIEARAEQTDSENRRYETWPLVEGYVTTAEMRQLMPLFTMGGDVYRAQIVGYFEAGNQSSRAEVVIDATTVNPKIILYRDLSHLGRGFDLSVLGLRGADALSASETDRLGRGQL